MPRRKKPPPPPEPIVIEDSSEEEEEEEEEEEKPKRRRGRPPKSASAAKSPAKKKRGRASKADDSAEDDEEEEEAPKTKRKSTAAAGGKRGRKKKQKTDGDEEEEDAAEAEEEEEEAAAKSAQVSDDDFEDGGEEHLIDGFEAPVDVLVKMLDKMDSDKVLPENKMIANNASILTFHAPFTRRGKQMFDAHGKLVGTVGKFDHSEGVWVAEEDPCAADPKLWRVTFDRHTIKVGFRRWGPTQPFGGSRFLNYRGRIKCQPFFHAQITSHFRLDMKRLGWLVAHGRSLPMFERVFATLAKLLPQAQEIPKLFGGAHVPFASEVPQRQPERVTLPLFHYQLDAVTWMLDVERRADTGFEFPLVEPIPGTDLLANFGNHYFVLPTEEQNRTGRFYARGGFLADTVGLGKTISMVSLAIQNPLSAKEVSEHPRFEHNLVRSRATLVICPSHLVRQWKEEIEKHTSPRLETVVVVAIAQLEKLTYKDLALADFVIVSIQFISANKNYLKRILLEPGELRYRGRDAQSQAVDIWRHKNPLAQRSPLLEAVHWHRLILDEGHETLSRSVPDWVANLKSTFRWYQSGTPLPHGETSLHTALQFLDFRVTLPPAPMWVPESVNNKELAKLLVTKRWGMTEGIVLRLISQNRTAYPAIRDALFWRNTKESAKEYAIPGVVEEVLLIEQSEVERAMYQEAAAHSADELRLRQLCCHPQISEFDRSVFGDEALSMEEIRSRLIDDRKRRAAKVEKEIADLGKDISEAKKLLKRSEDKSWAKRHIESLKRNVQDRKDALKELQTTISFLEGIVPKIVSSTTDPCPICLDPIREPSITTCGHIFCTACIKTAIASNPVCPSCRNHLDSGAVFRVQSDAQKAQIGEDSELAKLVEKLGAKMAHLITYIRKLFAQQPEARVIVFSEWDPLLHRVGATLEENGIRNVFVKGNVWCRDKAISLFALEGMKGVHVIMLSLENAASGLNLTEATHMVLLEPVAGTEEYAKAVETQAIGRAHRLGQKQVLTIVRLVCKGTIEEDIFERNKKAHRHSISMPEDEAASLVAASSKKNARDARIARLLRFARSFRGGLDDDDDEEEF